MGKKGFQDFIDELGRNKALRDAVKAMADKDSGVPVAALAKFAAGKGYSFSAKDVSAELSDEQLDRVAGGLLPASQLFTYKLDTGGLLGYKESTLYFKF